MSIVYSFIFSLINLIISLVINELLVEARDISSGEELTEDYRKIDNYQKIYPWLVDKNK